MKTGNILYYAIVLISMYGCSTYIRVKVSDNSHEKLDSTVPLRVYLPEEQVPEGLTLIGKMQIEYSVFCNDCRHGEMETRAKIIAREAGGNIVKVTEITEPEFPGHCYKWKADILFSANSFNIAKSDIEWGIDPGCFENKTQGIGFYTLGGMGMGFSVEYEKRLSKGYNGFGIRIGIGIAAFDITYTTIPVQLNYLLGGQGFFLEIGSGITYLRNNVDNKTVPYNVLGMQIPGDHRNAFLFSATIGGRAVLESNNKYATMLRFGFTPILGYGQYLMLPFLDLECAF